LSGGIANFKCFVPQVECTFVCEARTHTALNSTVKDVLPNVLRGVFAIASVGFYEEGSLNDERDQNCRLGLVSSHQTKQILAVLVVLAVFQVGGWLI
jgi:hypothetical protein